MRPLTGLVLVAILLTASVQFWMNADEFDGWLIDKVTQTEETPVVAEMQAEEYWPVILVDFDSDQLSTQEALSKADSILSGTYSIEEYFNQISAGNTQTTLVYNVDVIRAQHSVSWYGKDSNDKRDAGDESGDGPATLAKEAIENSEFNWSKFDLNDDGWVDRLLILHSSKPQEDGSGASNRIWSHHGPLVEPLQVASGLKVSHYTMASLNSENYRGTIYHEMLHQLGAPDLYPVHNELAGEPWKGVGDWDVMASGNWNANGRIPALPSAAVMEVIGASRVSEMSLQWDSNAEWCAGPQVSMKGMSQEGTALKIPLADEEYILIEARYDSGFDVGLPGHGILVTQLDLKAGDLADNEVNSDSTRPWLKVMEADSRQDMINSNSEGEESDVFTDGGIFGREGVQIRDRGGILVDWQANVSGIAGDYTITFGAEDCGYKGVIELPDYGSIIIEGQEPVIPLQIDQCTPVITLEGNKGTTVNFTDNILYLNQVTQFDNELISGTIDCAEGGLSREVSHSVQTLGNVPLEGQIISGEIHTTDSMSYEMFIEFEGNGTQEWNLMLDGPVSRIAKIDSEQSLSSGEGIRLDVDPAGLLSEGMVVKGILVIADDAGHRWEIELDFKATNDPGSVDLMEQIRRPGSVIAIALFALSLWILFEINWSSTPGNRSSDLQETQAFSTFEQADPFLVDSLSETD